MKLVVLLQNLDIHVQVCWLPIDSQNTHTLINTLHYKYPKGFQIQLYTVLTEEKSTIFTVQSPFHVFKEVHISWHHIFKFTMYVRHKCYTCSHQDISYVINRLIRYTQDTVHSKISRGWMIMDICSYSGHIIQILMFSWRQQCLNGTGSAWHLSKCRAHTMCRNQLTNKDLGEAHIISELGLSQPMVLEVLCDNQLHT